MGCVAHSHPNIGAKKRIPIRKKQALLRQLISGSTFDEIVAANPRQMGHKPVDYDAIRRMVRHIETKDKPVRRDLPAEVNLRAYVKKMLEEKQAGRLLAGGVLVGADDAAERAEEEMPPSTYGVVVTAKANNTLNSLNETVGGGGDPKDKAVDEPDEANGSDSDSVSSLDAQDKGASDANEPTEKFQEKVGPDPSPLNQVVEDEPAFEPLDSLKARAMQKLNDAVQVLNNMCWRVQGFGDTAENMSRLRAIIDSDIMCAILNAEKETGPSGAPTPLSAPTSTPKKNEESSNWTRKQSFSSTSAASSSRKDGNSPTKPTFVPESRIIRVLPPVHRKINPT